MNRSLPGAAIRHVSAAGAKPRPRGWGRTGSVLTLSTLLLASLLSGMNVFSSPIDLRKSLTEHPITRSFSGQFIIRDINRNSDPLLGQSLGTNAGFIRLQGAFLAVSCERTKQALLRKLDALDNWRGTVCVNLHVAGATNDPIRITAEHFGDGWNYELDLPNVVRTDRYIQAVTQVLLMEMANRSATDHSAEVPFWLSMGLAEELLGSDELEVIGPSSRGGPGGPEGMKVSMELLVPPPQATVNGLTVAATNVDARAENSLKHAHVSLSRATPLGFQQLSWPSTQQLEGSQADVFRASSQLFVAELLRLKSGRLRLLTMLSELPRFYNWQLALLDAFHDDFATPLDVEKWWALQTTHFTERELTDNWGERQSWQKLEALIHPRVQVRQEATNLPLHASVTLQTIIKEWQEGPQTSAIKSKLIELTLLRPRLVPEIAAILDDYQTCLDSFLQHRDHPTLAAKFHPATVRQQLIERTLKELDDIDVRCAKFAPNQKQEPPAEAVKAALEAANHANDN